MATSQITAVSRWLVRPIEEKRAAPPAVAAVAEAQPLPSFHRRSPAMVKQYTALPLSPAVNLFGFALALAGGLGLAYQTGAGPMRHAVAGALHLAAHPRPGRFDGGLSTALPVLDLADDRLGIETPADMAWNRLLSFDACIQCGRCETACPAFAAGQPLNPKRFIQDLAAASTPGGDPAYAGSPYPNARPVAGISGMHAPIVGAEGLVHPDTLWSCTTCRAWPMSPPARWV